MLSQRKEEERKYRQNLILNGALQIFKDKGLEKATMEEIAHSAGFGTATLYYYFPSKDDVFLAILVKGWKTLLEGIEDIINLDIPSEEKFLDTIYEIAGIVLKELNLYRFLFQAPQVYPSISEQNSEWKDYQNRLYATLQGLLKDGIKEGAFPKVKPELLMKGIGGIFHTILFMGDGKKSMSKAEFKILISELLTN
ncbi:MAG: TetR/AcrR family transcriptional regulator [Candidatus Marinimicrobia bacterium]|nr:TetR/AcrR family transcriptional regulator [Candidatus Neomarinimicrobiota bacterium]